MNAELEGKVDERTRELTASENRFNEVAKATNDTIWDWSLVNNTMWRSNNLDIMFGYSNSAETSNIGFWFDKIHPDDRKQVKDSVYEAINGNQRQWSAEYRFLKADGKYAIIFDRGSILHDDFNMPYRMVGSMVDITKTNELQKELMEKKDEFMSIASHELKTPITSIKAFLQLAARVARKGVVNDDMLAYIDKAARQLDNLTFLVSDLLDVSKIHAGKMQFNYSHFNMRSIIIECVGDMQNTEDFEIIIEHVDDVEIYADQHRIEQVLKNFLSNAIKYSPESKAVIVYTERIADEIKVVVKDFGIGIPKDKANMVFDRFFRVDNSNYQFSGLGLGLYICAEIVTRHDGTVGVESEEGKGSEFWFQVPLSGPEAAV
ncbi:Sensor histidine kinase YycG [compost metagenome]